jgi:hypothetical protein
VVVKTSDGKRFAGKDAVAVVARMKSDQWHIEGITKREYKEEVAGRVQQMTGEVIRLDAEGFLLDLQGLKLLKIEGGGEA